MGGQHRSQKENIHYGLCNLNMQERCYLTALDASSAFEYATKPDPLLTPLESRIT